MNFNGIDFNYNNLLDLEEGERNFIPKRQNTLDNQDTWSDGPEEDLDRIHQFCIEPCGNRSNSSRQDCLEENEIEVSVLPASSNAINDGSITLNIPSGASDLDVIWTELGSDTEIGDGTNILSKRLPGIYCWEFDDPECCIKWSNCYEVKNCEDNIPITLVTNPKCKTLEIELSVSGGIEPYTFEWREGQNPNSPVLDINKNFFASLPGEYCVEVTDACGQLKMICQEVGINLRQNLSTEIHDYCNGIDGYGSINLLLKGNTSGYSFHWDTGDETSYITGLEYGEYCVTITNNSECSATRCYTVEENYNLVYETSNSCYGQSDGEISLTNLYAGAKVDWDNGLTGINIEGLDAGTYCYQYNTEACGLLTDCITIDYDCCSEIVFNPRVDQPTGCDLDGRISFFASGAGIDGVVYPIEYNWSTGSTENKIENLPPGTYSLTVTDAIGCTATETWILSFEDFVTETISIEACEGMASGIGIIFASNNGSTSNSTGNFQFVWSDGYVTSDGVVSFQENLLAGDYTVTITDLLSSTSCSVEIELIINELESDGDLEANADITATCPDEAEGNLVLNISGGNGPYNIEWENGSSSLNQEGLAEGNYQVTITDWCQRQLVEQFEIPSFQVPKIELLSSQGCEGEGTAEFYVDANTDYSLSWVPNFSGLSLSNLSSGTYCAFIGTADGCVEKTCFDLAFGGGTLNYETTESCEGMGNGILDIDINVTNIGEYVEIFLIDSDDNQLPLFVGNALSNPIMISQGSLEPGDYTLLYGLACGDYTQEVTIEEIETLDEFKDYTKSDNKCKYERICDGILLETIEKDGVYDYLNAYSNWSHCNTPILCPRRIETGKKQHFPFRMMRVGFYRILLTQIMDQSLSGMPQAGLTATLRAEEGLNKIRKDLQDGKISLCSSLSYCTADYRITRYWPSLFAGEAETMNPIGGNCFEMSCFNGIFGYNVTECFDGEDLGLDANAFDYPLAPDPSDIRTAPISVLINFHQNGILAQNIPNYFETDLRDKLLDLIEGMPNERYNCAKITFRIDDGFVLGNNLDEVICGIQNVSGATVLGFLPPGYYDCEIYQYATELEGYSGYVYCGEPCSYDEFGNVDVYCVTSHLISNSWNTINFQADSEDNFAGLNAINSKILLSNPVFGDSISGIYKSYIDETISSEGQDFIIEYLSRTKFEHKDNLNLKNVTSGGIADQGRVEESILSGKNYEKERKAIFAIKENDSNYKIRLEELSGQTEIDLLGDVINFIDFDFKTDHASVLVGSHNNISVAGQFYSGGNHDYQIYEIKIFGGNVVSVNNILSFDGDDNNVIHAEYNDSQLNLAVDISGLAFNFLDEELYLTGRKIISIKSDPIFGQLMLEEKYLVDPTINIESFKELNQNDGDVFGISGYGEIKSLNSNNINHHSLVNGFGILTYDNKLNSFETLNFPDFQIENDEIEITESKAGDIYLGASTSSSFVIDQASYGGTGIKDLVIFKTDFSLSSFNAYSYGAEEFEFELKVLEADSLGLYIGGNILSPPGTVEIENKTIYVLDNSGEHSFMVYNYYTNTSIQQRQVENQSSIDKNDNLFCDKVQLYVAGKEMIVSDPINLRSIEIFDQLGRLVLNSKTFDHRTELFDLVPSIYFIRYTSKDGQVCSKKVWIGN